MKPHITLVIGAGPIIEVGQRLAQENGANFEVLDFYLAHHSKIYELIETKYKSLGSDKYFFVSNRGLVFECLRYLMLLDDNLKNLQIIDIDDLGNSKSYGVDSRCNIFSNDRKNLRLPSLESEITEQLLFKMLKCRLAIMQREVMQSTQPNN